MSAAKFLDKLDQTGLLDDKVITALRKQVAGSKKQVSAQAVAKLLIEKGHLTNKQAKKLLEGIDSSAKKAPTKAKPAAKPQDDDLQPLDDDLQPLDDDLQPLDDDLQPLDDDLQPVDELTPVEDELSPVDDDLTPLDDDDSLTPLDDEPDEGLTPLNETEDLTPIDDGGLTPVEDDDGLTALDEDDDGGLTPLDADGLEPSGSPEETSTDTAPEKKGGKKAGAAGVMQTVKGGLSSEPAVRTTVWDSKLLLLGGGGLIFLVLAGVVLFVFLSGVPAKEMFEAAETAYREQSYGQAIELYERFLEEYPNDERASQAKVRRGMARLRNDHSLEDWDKTYNDAKEILPEIDTEKAFGEFARPELATILPDIAAGFAEKGRGTSDLAQSEALADKAEAAMELVDNPNYIPTSFLTTQLAKIERIREDIALIRRNLNEEAELKQAIAKIDEQLGEGETVAAFEVRRNLLKLYPGLEVNPELIDAVKRISDKERELVELVESQLQPVTTEEEAPTDFSVIVASRRGDDATGVSEGPLFVLAKGSVYGLDAISGKVLWRRYVGFATDTHPLTLGVGADADALLVDTNRHELLRLEGTTGELQWRLPLPAEAAPFTAPVMLNELIYVGDRSGTLREIVPEEGTVKRVVQIPKPLVVGPVLDQENELIYQLGEHSNMYVLDANSLECIEVYYLGHKEGSVTLRPTLVRGVVFIAENVGSDYSVMRVLLPDSKTKKLGKLIDPIRLTNPVRTPMLSLAAGNVGRLIALSERGSVQVYEVDLRNEKQPVIEVAKLAETLNQPQVGQHLVDGGEYWLSDKRLTHYDIQTTRNQLARDWVKDDEMIALAPLEKRGKVLFTVRRRKGSLGVSIAAVQAVDGERLWQTDVGVPLAGPAIVDQANRRIVAVTSHGELFDIDAAVLQNGYIDKPSQSYDLSEFVFSYNRQLPLGEGRFLFFNPAEPEKVLVLDLANSTRRLDAKTLPVGPGAITTALRDWQGGLLLPLLEGQVQWYDLAGTGKQILPFQPSLETGTLINWNQPAMLSESDQFAITSDQKKVYRIGLDPQPKPHLTALNEANLDSKPIAPLAASADTLYGIARKEGADQVFSFALPNLTPNEDHQLQGLVNWGPYRLGNSVLLTTNQNELVCFATGNQPKWQLPLSYGPLAGPPIGSEQLLIMASSSGVVSMHDTAANEEKLKVEIAQPLSEQPVIFNDRLLLSGSDGVIHVTGAVVPADFPSN